MRRVLSVGIVALVLGLSGSVATADQSGTPYGYEDCGARDFTNGGWTDTPEDGAFVVAYARGMTCTSARRNVSRLRFGRKAPYRPYRPGYRCRYLARGYEYSDIRCVRRGRSRVAFRTRSGA